MALQIFWKHKNTDYAVTHYKKMNAYNETMNIEWKYSN